MCTLARMAGEAIVFPHRNCNYFGGKHGDGKASSDMWDNSGHRPTNHRDMSCQRRHELYVRGGFSYGQIEHELWESDWCPKMFLYGTMLREPLALMQSMINFHPDIGKGFLDNLRHALRTRTTEPDQGSEGSWKLFDNFQVRVLANAMDVPGGGITEEHVNKAFHKLQAFEVVARLEDLTPSHPMFVTLGWQKVRYMIGSQDDGGPNRNHHDEGMRFTESELDWLRELNKHDYSLYESFDAARR